ncbi:MAG: hypothetical protein LBU67_01170 [Oscillospiraceae bacterium]|jgi:predicted homoserine dehydrogenase-like protein|nr:hypothetical protein [Oscillospiraceae bacterium]
MIYEQLFRKTDGMVRAGLIGCGDFGATIVTQGHTVPRLQLRAVAERDTDRAMRAYLDAGVPAERIALCDTPGQAHEAYAGGRHIIVRDAAMLMEMPLEVIVCCTRSPEWGARYARMAIRARKHVVMVDKEADSVVGPVLKRLADAHKVVYTTDDGDEPGLLMGMVGWARSMGMEVLAGGNAHEALFDPDTRTIASRGKVVQLTGEQLRLMERVRPENLREVIAARRALTDAFRVDEECADPYCHMAVAANGTGLLPDRAHPLHPLVYWDELPSVLVPRDMGGIHDAVRCAVDIPTIIRKKGEPICGGSVYMVVRCPNTHAMEKMRRKGLITNFDVSAGVLYRPYHLCGAESAMSILCAGLLGVPTGGSELQQHVDIICSVRRAMRAGETIGPQGDSGWNRDFCCSLARGARLAQDAPIPFFMLEGNRLACDVPEGAVITLGMVEAPKDSALWELRREQDALFADKQ